MFKKITLWVLTLMGAGMIAHAQTNLTPVTTDWEGGNFIPAEFTSDNKPLIIGINYYGYSDICADTITLYNSSFSKIKSLVLPADSALMFDDYGTQTKVGLHPLEIEFCNFDLGGYENDFGVGITQNLFNNDEKFEYITFSDTKYGYDYATALNIRSEDGSILHTLSSGSDGYWLGYPELIKLDGKYYIVVNGWKGTEELYKLYIFRIDKNTQTVTRVETDLPFSVLPSVANRNQQITISFEEDSKVSEVSVVDATGRVLKKVPVQPGQKEIKLSTQGMSTGMNIIHATGSQGQGNCKIIVK